MPERAAFRRRVGVLVALLSAAALLAASDPAHAVVREGFEHARLAIVAHPTLGKVVFVLVSVLSAMLAFFSSAVIVPVAVYAWGEATTLVLLWGAWLIGGAASYLVGRTLGRRVVAWAISPARVDYYAVHISSLGESFVRGDYALLVGLGIAGIAFSATAFHQLHRRWAATPITTTGCPSARAWLWAVV